MAPGANEVIEIEPNEINEVSREVIKLLQTKDLTLVEIFATLECVRFSFTAAEIEATMKKIYGLVRVEK